MDIYCPRCAEPWDNESFHDRAEENRADADRDQAPLPGTVGALFARPAATTYQLVIEDFQRRGCEAMGVTRCEMATGRDRLRADVSAMLMELGDMDGAMSDLEDFEYLGMFETGDDE
jgi:hypothetical protein